MCFYSQKAEFSLSLVIASVLVLHSCSLQDSNVL